MKFFCNRTFRFCKSETMRALEDMDFIADNLPPALITKFAELCYQPNSSIDKVALGIDIRGRKFWNTLWKLIVFRKRKLWVWNTLLRLFRWCFIKRYKMTRRNHPLSKYTNTRRH